MAQTWEHTTEMVVGLLLENRISLTLVRPELFFPPYDTVVKQMKKGSTPEEIVEKCGFLLVQTAHEAVMGMNGLGESINWVSLLEKTKSLYDAGQKFGKWQKKLERGEDINWSEVTDEARKVQVGQAGDFIPLSEVESQEVPFISSGWDNIDKHLGGWPSVGMVLIGGDPGAGKTTFTNRAALSFARKYPDKKVAVFSLEMISCELAMRFREIEKADKSIESRILLNETPAKVPEIINKASTIEDLGLIVIDFIDLTIDENSEASYAEAYKSLMFGAKQLHIPMLVNVQLVKAKNGLPRPIHLRYTKLAESFAWMILMLYDPSRDWDDTYDKNGKKIESVLPVRAGAAYILCWKVRGGFRQHKDEAPGAIQLPFSGEKGWSLDRSRWFSLKKIA